MATRGKRKGGPCWSLIRTFFWDKNKQEGAILNLTKKRCERCHVQKTFVFRLRILRGGGSLRLLSHLVGSWEGRRGGANDREYLITQTPHFTSLHYGFGWVSPCLLVSTGGHIIVPTSQPGGAASKEERRACSSPQPRKEERANQ